MSTNQNQDAACQCSPLFQSTHPAIGIRALHLDLKGLPPTPERLLQLLDTMAVARYNAVLVEWEDMFPWTCDVRFRCATAYTASDVRRFHDKAQSLGIEIIPLVQCLGHMETPLKFPEYAHMREVPERPDVLNPLAPGARELVERMVDDVLAALPDVKHFHLGGDEAWTFGSHPDTKAYIEAHGKGALYMQHVEPLLDKLLAKGIRPILWHDMMIHWDSDSLHHLKDKADLCVWGYAGHPANIDPKRHYHISHIRRFCEHGVTLWGATAYKGADGSDSELPNFNTRLANIKAWTEVAQEFQMKGAIATAWSRYNTMLTQVEPIDAALDLLVLAGQMLHDGKTPDNPAAVCEQLLQLAGEQERFQACRAPLAEFARAKNAAWEQVRLVRETLACINLDADRKGSPSLNAGYTNLQNQVRKMEAKSAEIVQAYAGLVPDIWIKRFVGDRVLALQNEIADLENRMK